MTIDKPPLTSEDEPADEFENSAVPPEQLVEGVDYYIEDGLLVMTAAFHKKRGTCCGNRCRWCPFEPKYELGTTTLASNPPLPANGATQS
jgi:hypothetical protein